MDEVKPSVNQQLEHINQMLEPKDHAHQQDQALEVLSSEGLHEASLAHSPSPQLASAPELHQPYREVQLGEGVVPPQVLPESQPQGGSEPLRSETLVETPSEVSLTPEFHEELAQVLATFSDSWVNEMTQRVGVLREQITLVHNKLDQFSPR